MDAMKKVKLDTPIKRGEEGEEIREVSLRKPNAGELRGLTMADLARLDVNAMITLLPRITVPNLSVAEVRQLQTEDFFALTTEVGSFLLTKADMAGYPEA